MEFQDLIDAGFWPADLTEATLQRARDGLTKAARRQAGYPGYKDDLATLKRARDHFQVQLAAMSVIFPYAILAARDAEVPISTALRRVKDLCEFRDPEGGLGLVAEPPFDGAPPVQPPPHPNVSEMVPREWFSWLLDVRRESEGRSAHAIDHRAAWEERAVALARALRVPGAQSPHKTTSYDSLVLATAAAMPIALLLHPRTGVWDLPAQGWSLLVLEALTSPPPLDGMAVPGWLAVVGLFALGFGRQQLELAASIAPRTPPSAPEPPASARLRAELPAMAKSSDAPGLLVVTMDAAVAAQPPAPPGAPPVFVVRGDHVALYSQPLEALRTHGFFLGTAQERGN